MEKVLGNILFLIGDQRGAKTNFLKDLELPSSTIGDWKNGRNKSYMKRLPEIASYFDVSVDYLLGNTDIKKTPSSEEESETKKPTLFGYQEEEHFHVAPRNSGHSEEISPVTETVK
ncbi:MAG: hypothetical protein J6R00_04800, partial [Lentisphaeria bacterium]|nr:hypothetical protein [Lentisphaeria bacterium]